MKTNSEKVKDIYRRCDSGQSHKDQSKEQFHFSGWALEFVSCNRSEGDQ